MTIVGELTGNIRSTPIASDILRIVNVSVAPAPRRWITTPRKFCIRSLLPSRIRIVTVIVSPALNTGSAFSRSTVNASWAILTRLFICGTIIAGNIIGLFDSDRDSSVPCWEHKSM